MHAVIATIRDDARVGSALSHGEEHERPDRVRPSASEASIPTGKWPTCEDDSTTWRYFGQLDGYFYANFYTKIAGHWIVAGHPLTCDRPELRSRWTTRRAQQRAFEIYNPTDQPIQARLKLNPTFFRHRPTLSDTTAAVEVGPFTSVPFDLSAF